MTVTITRLYDDYDSAARAVAELKRAGVSDSDISLVANNAEGWYASDRTGPVDRDRDGIDDRAEGATAGAGIGAAAGGIAGLLAGLGLLAIPGLGPVVAAGWLASTAAMAGAGGAVGGVVGALVESGTSREDAQVYAEGVRRGGALVSARVPEADATRYEAILDRWATDIRQRAVTYQGSGWRQFDPSAPAYTAEQVRAERESYRRRGDEMASTAARPLDGDETNRLISSEKVDGTAAYDRSGERLGSVHHLMIGKSSGHVEYAVMSFGGFLGIGEDYTPLPWRSLTYDTRLGGYRVDIDRNRLEQAPRYGRDALPNWSDRGYRERIDTYWMPTI
jgi:PRC-barrel domain